MLVCIKTEKRVIVLERDHVIALGRCNI